MGLPGWNSIPVTGLLSSFFFWLSIAALVLLGLAEVFSHRYGERHDLLVSQQQQAAKDASDGEIARLHRDTEALRNENLRLRKELGPRNLPFGAFVEALRNKPSATVEILYVADDWDSMALAQQIEEGLKAANWPAPSRRAIERPIGWSDPLAMSVDGQPTDITVVARIDSTEEMISAGSMLAPHNGALTPFRVLQEALLAGLGKAQSHVNGPKAPRAGILRVVVAPRG